jgi:transposase
MERDMGLILREIEAYQVHHLPLVKAYADTIGLVEVITELVPSERAVDPGTMGLGLVLDTLSGRRPLSRLEEVFAPQDTELRLGQALPAQAFNDATVGRRLARLDEIGTMKRFTAWAGRADTLFGLDKRPVHVDTTSMSVYGDYALPEDREVPFTSTQGYSQDKRPARKPFVLATVCVDRAVPLGGEPHDGNASDKTVHHTLLSTIATFLAQHGVAPGAYTYVADAALVTEENLAALGDTCFISRLPATYSECGRIIQEAVAHDAWEEVGALAQTKPTKKRPGTFYNVYEGAVTLYEQPYRAVVVQSSAQDQRRLKRLDRELQASYTTLRAAVRAAAKQEYFCRADAEVAAEALRAVQTDYHQVEVAVEERPQYGKGRPSMRQPRVVKAMRYGLQPTLTERSAHFAKKRAEAGCFVLLTNTPTAGILAHRAADVLKVYKEQHGVEQNYGFLKDPVIVNSLFLKKPERIEALGVVLLLALLVWRLMERSMRAHVDITGTTLTGWDKKETERPTAVMMMTKFAGVIVLKMDQQRQLARPLSAVQQQYLMALGVPTACFTIPNSG